MYEVRKDGKFLNGQAVDTFSMVADEGDASFEVEVGTNGFKGEDSRVYLKLVNVGNSNFMARFVEDEHGKPVGIELAFDGEEAFAALMKVIDFAVNVICDQAEEPVRRCGA